MGREANRAPETPWPLRNSSGCKWSMCLYPSGGLQQCQALVISLQTDINRGSRKLCEFALHPGKNSIT